MDQIPPATAAPPEIIQIPGTRFAKMNLTQKQVGDAINELMMLRQAWTDLTNRHGMLVSHFCSVLKLMPDHTISVPIDILSEMEASSKAGNPWAINQMTLTDPETKQPNGLKFTAMPAAEAVAKSQGINDGSVAQVNEEFIIPRDPPLTIKVQPRGQYAHHLGCRYKDPKRNEGKPLERVDAGPRFGQYFVREAEGVYGFSTDDLGQAVLLSYTFMRTPEAPEMTEAEKARAIDEVETTCSHLWHRDPARMGRRCPECGGAKTI